MKAIAVDPRNGRDAIRRDQLSLFLPRNPSEAELQQNFRNIRRRPVMTGPDGGPDGACSTAMSERF